MPGGDRRGLYHAELAGAWRFILEFLKRHYEKLILLFMLVAFIISMIHVLRIIQQTRDRGESADPDPEGGL